jgi:ankyrin repeat protein
MSARNEVIDNMDYSPEFTQLQKESESGSLFPLFYSREYELIEARLDAGADLNQLREGRPDDSLLSVAVSTEAEAVAMALISRGANVNFADSQGKTALHHAAVSGSAELIAALLEAGADPEAKTRTGFTPAMLARIAWVFEEEERPNQVHSLLSNQTQLSVHTS